MIDRKAGTVSKDLDLPPWVFAFVETFHTRMREGGRTSLFRAAATNAFRSLSYS